MYFTPKIKMKKHKKRSFEIGHSVHSNQIVYCNLSHSFNQEECAQIFLYQKITLEGL